MMRDKFVTVENVKQYISDLRTFYDEFDAMSGEKLYEHFLNLEESYICKQKYKLNFAKNVHQNHPLKFEAEGSMLNWLEYLLLLSLLFFSNRFDFSKSSSTFNDRLSSLKNFIRCPYCTVRLSAQMGYEVHILREGRLCENTRCGKLVCYESMAIAALVNNYNNQRLGSISYLTVPMVFDKHVDTWPTFTAQMIAIFEKESKKSTAPDAFSFMCRQLNTLKKCSARNFSPIFKIDLVVGTI
jgi:hypothetical protein